MASKRRLRRKACEGKRRYQSVADAQPHITNLYRRRKAYGTLQAYKCQFCGGYHVGRPPHRRQQRRRV